MDGTLIFICNVILGFLAGWGTKMALVRRGVSAGWVYFWAVVVGLIVLALNVVGRILAL